MRILLKVIEMFWHLQSWRNLWFRENKSNSGITRHLTCALYSIERFGLHKKRNSCQRCHIGESCCEKQSKSMFSFTQKLSLLQCFDMRRFKFPLVRSLLFFIFLFMLECWWTIQKSVYLLQTCNKTWIGLLDKVIVLSLLVKTLKKM